MNDDITVSVAEEARVFTRDFYFVTYGEKAQEQMEKAFRDYPGFAEGIAEGREVQYVLEDIMQNAFETFAWNNKVDPEALFSATQKLW